MKGPFKLIPKALKIEKKCRHTKEKVELKKFNLF